MTLRRDVCGLVEHLELVHRRCRRLIGHASGVGVDVASIAARHSEMDSPASLSNHCSSQSVRSLASERPVLLLLRLLLILSMM